MEGLENLIAVVDLESTFRPTSIALQETWLRTYKNVQFAEVLRTHKWIFKNADKHHHEEDKITMKNLSFHGVALGVENKVAEDVVEIEVQFKNIIAVKIKVGKLHYIIVNIYMPCAGKDIEFGEATAALRCMLEQNARNDERILITADTNVSNTSSKTRLRLWSSLLEDFDLVDNITGNDTHLHHVTGSSAELDRFITRGVDVSVGIIKDNLGTSDHKPIIGEWQVEEEVREEAVKGELIETKVNIKKLLESQEFFQELTNILADDIESWRHEHTLDDQNGLISSIIFQAAIETTGQDRFQSQKQRKPKRFKINKELSKGLKIAKKNYRNQDNKSKKSPAFKRVKRYKRLIKEDLEEQKKKYELEVNNEIIRATNENSSRLFALLKKVKQEVVNENKLPMKIEGYGLRFVSPHVLEGLRELFRLQTTIDYKERFDDERFQAAKQVVEAMRDEDWPEEEYEAIEMSEGEFQKIIDRLKSGKAQDFTGMSNDLMKNVGKRMKELIYNVTMESLQQRDIGGIIRNYGKGTVIIKKPGKPTTVIKNWRKIVVNNTILNMLQLHIQPKIEEKAKKIQTKFQLGFTAGIPIANAVIAREELQQISKKKKKTFFLGVLDLASCFPRICREEMLVLAAEILTPAEWDVLSQIYQDTWGEIRVESQKSRPMRGDCGSIEGGVLSVQILKIYIAVLLKMLEQAGFTAGVDFALSTVEAGQIGVADDILLFTWCPEKMRLMLKICQVWTDRYRATFSEDKSVIVIQRSKGDKKDHGTFVMNGVELKIVKAAEHLGIPISEDGDNTELLVIERMMKTRRAIYGSMSLFDQKSFVTAAVKLQVWKTQFRYVLIYGLDLANIKASQLKRIEQFQTKVLRNIFNLSRRASVVKLRLLTGTTTMAYEVWKCRFGALNNVLIGSTMTRDICLLAYYGEVKSSWTYKTVKKLHEVLVMTHGDARLDPVKLLTAPRTTFKTDIKNVMMGDEIRRLSRDLKDQEVYRIPADPLKNNFPLTNTGFNYKLQREMKSYVAVYCGDFYRNYSGPCYICMKTGRKSSSDQENDDTKHLLSGRCEVDRAPKVDHVWAEIIILLRQIAPNNSIGCGTAGEERMIRFLLNPTCLSLQQDRISPEDLQLSGLDIKIRKLHAEKLTERYRLLRKYGIVNKKKL